MSDETGKMKGFRAGIPGEGVVSARVCFETSLDSRRSGKRGSSVGAKNGGRLQGEGKGDHQLATARIRNRHSIRSLIKSVRACRMGLSGGRDQELTQGFQPRRV
jgi:hypothetical protein